MGCRASNSLNSLLKIARHLRKKPSLPKPSISREKRRSKSFAHWGRMVIDRTESNNISNISLGSPKSSHQSNRHYYHYANSISPDILKRLKTFVSIHCLSFL